MTVVLGVDPGFVNLGWAILFCQGSSVTVMASGVHVLLRSWKGACSTDMADAVRRLREKLVEQGLQWDLFFIEQQYQSRGINAAVSGRLRCLEWALSSGLSTSPFDQAIASRTLKARFGTATGNHADNKTRARQWVETNSKNFPRDLTDHEADAVMVAISGYCTNESRRITSLEPVVFLE